jgi:nucleotide-binding universal stress UspA family protein
MQPIVVVAYHDTPEAADGIALGRLLAEIQGAALVVAPVLTGTQSTRARISRAHRAVERALPPGARFELWPVFGPAVSEGVQALAADRHAGMIVFGSTRHGPAGHVLLGGSAASTVHLSPVPIAVAPRGFRQRPVLEPRVVGAAFDGSPEATAALAHANTVAVAAGAALRVIAVDPSPRAAAELARHYDDSVILHGDAAACLATETARLGLLVCGSRGHGPLGRLFLGSVSLALMISAKCPIVVVPPCHDAAQRG